MSREGKTEELRADRTVETAEGVNGGVRVNKESFVDCAFKEAVEAERRGNGNGVELDGWSAANRLDGWFGADMEVENWSIRAKVVVRATERVCSGEGGTDGRPDILIARPPVVSSTKLSTSSDKHSSSRRAQLADTRK